MEQLLFLNLGTPEIIILLFPVLLVTYCIADIITSSFKNDSVKILWILVVLVAPLIGSLIYLAVGRTQKIT